MTIYYIYLGYNNQPKEFTMNISQRNRIANNLKIVDVHNRQVVVTKDTNKVIGYAKNGKFAQDPLVVRTLQNSYDMQRVWGLG